PHLDARPVRRDRFCYQPGRHRPARLRLLLGRDRLPARRHPPGRPATLGSPAMTRHQIPPEDPARAAQWLLAEYDATDREELADIIGAVQARRTICVLKTLLDGGSTMRVTAPDSPHPDRWWL